MVETGEDVFWCGVLPIGCSKSGCISLGGSTTQLDNEVGIDEGTVSTPGDLRFSSASTIEKFLYLVLFIHY